MITLTDFYANGLAAQVDGIPRDLWVRTALRNRGVPEVDVITILGAIARRVLERGWR